MRLRLLSVGRPRDAEASRLHDRYAERMRRLGLRYESLWVPEVQPSGKYSDDHVREREAGHLRERLDRPGKVIALDRRGTMLDSESLSRRLPGWASPQGTLLLGGPLGLHPTLLDEVDERWSLSALTLPHELARVVVAEQVYRALTLIRGVPYHK